MSVNNGTPGEMPLAASSPAWMPQLGTTVMVISTSSVLHGEVARVSAAAAVGLVVAHTVEQAAGKWEGISAILVGSDVQSPLPGWNGPLVVVGRGQESSLLWARAADLGADRVAVLPESAQWLAGYLARLREPHSGGSVVGLVGANGGAGASTTALLLAARAVARGLRVLVVDADPLGGGLETMLAAEDVQGLRWPDLLNAEGAINPEQLSASLPVVEGVSLLSWPSNLGREIEPLRAGAALTREVFRAAKQGFSLVVVDFGKDPKILLDVGSLCEHFIMPVEGRLSCAAAARAVLQVLPAAPVSLLVRGRLQEGVDIATVSSTIGAPCLGSLPRIRGIEERIEGGRVGEVARIRKVRRVLDLALDSLGSEELGSGELGGLAPDAVSVPSRRGRSKTRHGFSRKVRSAS